MRGYEISKSKIHPVIRKPVFCLLYYPWLGSWWGFRFPIPSAIPVYFLIQSNEKCTGMISGFQQKCWAQHWKISGRDSRYFSESVPVGRLDYLKDGRRSMTKFKKEHQEQRAPWSMFRSMAMIPGRTWMLHFPLHGQDYLNRKRPLAIWRHRWKH